MVAAIATNDGLGGTFQHLAALFNRKFFLSFLSGRITRLRSRNLLFPRWICSRRPWKRRYRANSYSRYCWEAKEGLPLAGDRPYRLG